MSRRLLSVFSVALLVTVVAGAQEAEKSAVEREQSPPAHYEVPTQPPIAVERSSQPRTPAFRWSRDNVFFVQANVDSITGENIVGDAANEPSLAVNPKNADNMVIGWRQFDTTSSSWRKAGFAWTNDGGDTWSFPGSVDDPVFRSDPVVDVNTRGYFFYNSLTADDPLNWPDNFRCHVFKSVDGGQTWDGGTYAYGGDKQWQVIDLTDSEGRNNIYASWNRTYTCEGPGCDGHFTRSYDNGFTFTPCIDIDGNPYWGTLAVGPDGELYVSGNGITVTRSSNVKYEGQTVVWDVSTTLNLGGSMQMSTGPNPGGLLGQVWIDVDRSGGANHGNVYVLCSVDPPGADPLDVMFSRSTDGGQTWSAPVRVNDDPTSTNAWQWFGTMSVAPNGRIDAIWLDSRNDPGGYDSQLYYASSDDGGLTWSENLSCSPAFDPHVGWPQQNKMGDYMDMTSDDLGAHIAFAATLNGEQDVYYARIMKTLGIGFPNGLPELIPPGVATDITVEVVPGVENYVDGTATMYYRYDDGNYIEVPLTPLGGNLFTGTLPPVGCDDEPEFYFTAEGDQFGVVTQPPTAPGEGYTAVVGSVIEIYDEPLDVDPGWSTTGLWAYGQPTGGGGDYGNPDPTSGHTGPNVYGYNLNGDYEASLPERHLTSGPIDCSGYEGVTLSFWRWLGVETPTYDHAYVRVSTNGSTWATVWENTAEVTDSAWTYQEYDISSFADNQSTVYLRWTMGTTDYAWQYCGWNIDDIKLTAFGCEQPAEGACCAADGSCTITALVDCAGDWLGEGTVCDPNPCPQPWCLGDLNCSGGAPTFEDILYFVAAVEGETAWVDYYRTHGDGSDPDCPWLLGDFDTPANGVDFSDIIPFANSVGGACQVYVP